MKFTANKTDLITAIGRCISVTDQKSTMPILGCIYLEASEDYMTKALTIAATDLYRSIRVELSAGENMLTDQAGSLCLPARDLFERVKLLPDGKVAVSVEGTKATIKAVGSSRRFTLHGVPGEEFPKLPEPTAIDTRLETTNHKLLSLLGAVHHSISTDQTRLALNSLLIETEADAVRMVSTDGHRLTVMTSGHEPGPGAAKWLVPLAAVNDLRKLLDTKQEQTVSLVQSGASLFVQMPEYTFSTKLVDSAPVPWDQVVPKSTERSVSVNRSAVIDALRAVSAASNQTTGGVRFTFRKGELLLSAESPDGGEAFDQVATDYDGGTVEMGFNGRYVADALSVLGDETITIGTSGELEPALFQVQGKNDCLGIVMPMRI